MCLDINPKIHTFPKCGYTLNPEPLIAEEDMIVFKALKHLRTYDRKWLKDNNINYSFIPKHLESDSPAGWEENSIRIPSDPDAFLTPYRNADIKAGVATDFVKWERSDIDRDHIITLGRKDGYPEVGEDGYRYSINKGHHAFLVVTHPNMEKKYYQTEDEYFRELIDEGRLDPTNHVGFEFDHPREWDAETDSYIPNEGVLRVIGWLSLKPAIIPKGTKYYVGVDGDVVAEQLILSKDKHLEDYIHEVPTVFGTYVPALISPQTMGKWPWTDLDLRDNGFGEVCQALDQWSDYSSGNKWTHHIIKNKLLLKNNGQELKN